MGKFLGGETITTSCFCYATCSAEPKSDTKHSTRYYKGGHSDEEYLGSNPSFNIRLGQDDDSDVKTLECFEECEQQKKKEELNNKPTPPSPVRGGPAPRQRNILQQFPILNGRNNRNNNMTTNSSNKQQQRSFYSGNNTSSFVNPASWLNRSNAPTAGTVERKNLRNLRLGRYN